MMSIAVVEDNPADAALLRDAICRTGLSVEMTLLEDGQRAVAYLSEAHDCDLVVLDLSLPGMTGLEVLEHLRSRDESRALPVVVLSGSADPADVERSYRAGANSYICKPVHLDGVLEMANQLVRYWSICAIVPSNRSSPM